MRRAVAAVLALAALATPGTAAAETKPHGPALARDVGRCVKKKRDEQAACSRAALERCRDRFASEVPDCFLWNADCARGCVTEQSKCRRLPDADDAGCGLACGGAFRAERDRCPLGDEARPCFAAARVKFAKCKQACGARAGDARQACLQRFDDCLADCNRGVTGP
jgi:hypothetical protein